MIFSLYAAAKLTLAGVHCDLNQHLAFCHLIPQVVQHKNLEGQHLLVGWEIWLRGLLKQSQQLAG
jgi:hypothetical protein